MVSIDLRALADGLRLHSIGSLVAFTCALDSLLDSMRHSMVSPAMNRTQQRELVELLNFLLGKRARLGIMAAAAPGVSNWPAQKAFIIQVFEWNDTGTVSQLHFTKDLKSYQMLAAMHRNDTTAIADFAWDEFGGGNGRGGNGRGGNGRGGNNTRKCYNCGQAGHISRDCRVNGGGKGGGGKRAREEKAAERATTAARWATSLRHALTVISPRRRMLPRAEAPMLAQEWDLK